MIRPDEMVIVRSGLLVEIMRAHADANAPRRRGSGRVVHNHRKIINQNFTMGYGTFLPENFKWVGGVFTVAEILALTAGGDVKFVLLKTAYSELFGSSSDVAACERREGRMWALWL